MINYEMMSCSLLRQWWWHILGCYPLFAPGTKALPSLHSKQPACC